MVHLAGYDAVSDVTAGAISEITGVDSTEVGHDIIALVAGVLLFYYFVRRIS